MSYEASAFDALKYVQYYQGAEYKYFVNLAGTSNNPGIPKDGSKDYLDGINRMNNSEIFYVSNAQDGQVVTDSTYEKNEDGSIKKDELGNPILAKNPDGTPVHQGLGASNGCIATSDDYVSQMAEFIAKNYFEGNHFQKAQISSELPLASFYVKDAESEKDQIMTVHLKHLGTADDNTLKVNIFDKSVIGTLSGADGKLTGYKYAVYDPSGAKKIDTGWQNVSEDANWKEAMEAAIPTYTFNSGSQSGTYVFELTVRDSKGNESKTFQTYVTAYMDDEIPFIEGRKEKKNKATISLTDTGEGIDEDGITFIKDGRGSGVAAYWVTNDPNAKPSDDEWTELDTPVHQYEFDLDIDSTDPLVVWVRDECGNIGNKAVFQPTHVRVEDKDGNPIDDYYVIDKNPIIVLPDDDVVPPSEDEDEYHTGWSTPEGDPVTPGTTPDPDSNHEIVIRPDYSKDQAAMVYMPNGGTIDGKDKAEFRVTGGASILKKVGDHEANVEPTREGYTFKGWNLLKSHSAADATNSTYINNAANVEEITTQLATATQNAGKELQESDYHYLIAQWEIGTYTLKLDANGGSLGNVRSIANVPFEQDITAADISQDAGTQAIPSTGRGLPTRAGYIFQGWSESNDNKTDRIFMKASGTSWNVIPAPKMPAKDKTIYAVWTPDTTEFRVTFDSNGGSKVSGQAYLTAIATNYDAFSEPSRPGYTFDGWYYSEDLTGKTDTNEFGIVFKDGVDKPIKYAGTESVITKADHEFVAMWTPNTDTKYTVEYYYKTGRKDGQDRFIYTRVAEKTQNRTAATESKVKVEANDVINELTVDGNKYWYNKDNTNNVLEGTVTGNPQLALKMYFDRYFDVTASKKGNGTVTGTSDVKEGAEANVSWSASKGYHVSKVVVDGAVRDDLLNKTSYTYEDVHENHEIYVEFKQDTSGGGSVKQPEEQYYNIKTSVVGCPDSSKYTITPTTRVKGGVDHKVEWSVNADSQYRVVKVTVDGVEYDAAKTDVSFKSISSNHEVVVTLEALPIIGGDTSEGNYTITVNRYGGCGKEEISPSTTVNAGDSCKVTWNLTDKDCEHQIYKVYVDGVEKSLTTSQKTKSGAQSFSAIKANHVVDIYLVKTSATDPDNPSGGEIDVPTYPQDEYIKVDTKIIGGPGTITGGAVIEKNSDYNVEWNFENQTTSDVTDSNYAYYELDKVVVDGKEVDTGEDKTLTLDNIDKNTAVEVHLKPVLYNVTIKKFGEGTVSPSKTLYKLQNYQDIVQSPAEGWVTAKIVYDGNVIYTNPLLDSVQTAAKAKAQSKTETVDEKALSQAEDTEVAVANEKAAAPVAKASARDAAPAINDIMGIVEDHEIEVYFVKVNKTDETTGEPTEVDSLPDPKNTYNVNVKIEGGEGDILSGPAIVAKGDNDTVKWSFDTDKYELDKVTVNGKTQTLTKDNEFGLENIAGNKDVVITLKKKIANDEDNPVPGNIDVPEAERNKNVTAILQGAGGTISGSGEVANGADRVITWTPDKVYKDVLDENGNPVLDENGQPKKEECNVSVKYIYITKNGKTVAQDLEALKKSGLFDEANNTLKLENITADTKVVVVLGVDDLPPVDIDSNDDGKPDINIDKDGDGNPDINIDQNGDGNPDLNIDTNGDGQIDTVQTEAPFHMGYYLAALLLSLAVILYVMSRRFIFVKEDK